MRTQDVRDAIDTGISITKFLTTIALVGGSAFIIYQVKKKLTQTFESAQNTLSNISSNISALYNDVSSQISSVTKPIAKLTNSAMNTASAGAEYLTTKVGELIAESSYEYSNASNWRQYFNKRLSNYSALLQKNNKEKYLKYDLCFTICENILFDEGDIFANTILAGQYTSAECLEIETAVIHTVLYGGDSYKNVLLNNQLEDLFNFCKDVFIFAELDKTKDIVIAI